MSELCIDQSLLPSFVKLISGSEHTFWVYVLHVIKVGKSIICMFLVSCICSYLYLCSYKCVCFLWWAFMFAFVFLLFDEHNKSIETPTLPYCQAAYKWLLHFSNCFFIDKWLWSVVRALPVSIAFIHYWILSLCCFCCSVTRRARRSKLMSLPMDLWVLTCACRCVCLQCHYSLSLYVYVCVKQYPAGVNGKHVVLN